MHAPLSVVHLFVQLQAEMINEYKQIPRGYHSVPEISLLSSCCKLNLQSYTDEKCKVLSENMQDVCQRKGGVPSLGWTDLQLMQINMEGYFYYLNKTCNPHAPTGNSSSSSSIPLPHAFWWQGTLSRKLALLDVVHSTHYESKLTERVTACLYKVL